MIMTWVSYALDNHITIAYQVTIPKKLAQYTCLDCGATRKRSPEEVELLKKNKENFISRYIYN